MTTCLITDRPDHPVLAEMVERLSDGQPVRVLSPDCDAETELAMPAGLYLMKSHTAAALALGAHGAGRHARRGP